MDMMTQSPDDQGQGGYTIEIEVAADGTIQVCSESQAEEGSEDEQNEDMSKYMPAADINEALQIAKTIYRNNGQMPDKSAEDQTMQDAKAGYSKRAPKPMGGAMDAVFGE